MGNRRRHTFDAVAAALAITLTAIAGMFCWLLIGLICLFCSGCTSTKYIPVETIKTEYQDKIKEVHTTDSVVDTRFVYIKGDTVVDWRDRIKWRDRLVYDSVFIETHDTIPVPYPVERKLSQWEQVKINYGGVAIWVLLITICTAVIWLTSKAKR